MKATPKDLQKIKGIGAILGKRLIEEGFDSFTKVAAAGEDGLKGIKGINPRIIGSILEQASQLAADVTVDKETRVAELKQGINELRAQIQSLTEAARDRFQEELSEKTGRKLTKNFVQVLDSLEAIEQKLPKRFKRAGKSLDKAELLLSSLLDADMIQLRNGLKKTRKALKKVLK